VNYLKNRAYIFRPEIVEDKGNKILLSRSTCSVSLQLQSYITHHLCICINLKKRNHSRKL
jgi:hypothetical protein